ncbi:hypothetical protein LJ739_08535 [Aestuariibacter halophilus]|uniref:Solute-binding protein family 3/N-terminal domain-containing protein n=1 Tax=Fluctibacter halophilus TaxID=226011 RepID=A0ABS8G6W1_9ALTE|nr:hypothetical protein [Aestuariibacter halophilus]MCC2616285.1 hypothetical protein [Aestuariibacter halophilus]
MIRTMIILGCLWCAGSQANADSTLVWGINNAPPFHIMSEPFKHAGLCDVLVDELIDRLPDLKHQRYFAPHSRIRQQVIAGENLCFPCMIKRPPSEHWYFSDVTALYPPHQLIARTSALERWQGEEVQVSLRSLLNRKELVFGISASRKFPPTIQRLIDNAPFPSTQVQLTGTEGTVRLLNQINLDRIQYTIDYPAIFRYYTLSQGLTDLSLSPIAENHDEWVYGAIGCTNNAWGRHVIGAINRAIPAVLEDKTYLENQSFWQGVPQQELVERLRKTDPKATMSPP